MQVVDDGVVVELTGSNNQNLLLYLSIGLIVLAIAVAVIVMTMAVEFAIGAIAVFAVLVFLFNQKRQQNQNNVVLSSGKMFVRAYCIRHQNQTFLLSSNANIYQSKGDIVIKDQAKTLVICGIDSERYRQVVCQVLQGQKIAKKSVNIKLNSTQ